VVKTVTSINGRLVPKREARVSVFDNSLLYAEGLFETFLAVDDNAIFSKEHLQRLTRGAKTIGLDLPATPDRLTKWMKRILRAHPSRIKKLRLTLTSGESARWLGRSGRPQIILSAAPHKLPTEPFRLHVSRFKVDHQSIFRQIKTLSYAINAAAFKKALELECDDAPLGCLEGVTRRIVLREAQQLGIRIHEQRCSLDRLAKADEVFISSSLKLLIGVGLIKHGRRRLRFRPGPVADVLRHHFLHLAGIQ